PAVQAAKESGVTLTLWCGTKNTVHNDLIVLADEVHHFDWQRFPQVRAKDEGKAKANNHPQDQGDDEARKLSEKSKRSRRSRRAKKTPGGAQPATAGNSAGHNHDKNGRDASLAKQEQRGSGQHQQQNRPSRPRQ